MGFECTEHIVLLKMNEMKDKSMDDAQEVGAVRRFVRTAVLKKTWTRNEIVTSACLYLTILGWVGIYIYMF